MDNSDVKYERFNELFDFFNKHQKEWIEEGKGDKYVFLTWKKDFEPVFLDNFDHKNLVLDKDVILVRKIDPNERCFDDCVLESRISSFYINRDVYAPAPGASKEFEFHFDDGQMNYLGSFSSEDVAEGVFDALERFKKRAKVDTGQFVISESYSAFEK